MELQIQVFLTFDFSAPALIFCLDLPIGGLTAIKHH